MAETSLSIAVSILRSVISKATAAAVDEMSLLMGVQKEIWFMKDELKTMQAFLIAAEEMKKKRPLLKVWAEQVRSLSYDIEDCLDEFMVHIGSKSMSHHLLKLKDRRRIAAQIRNLKSRVEEVSMRNTRYKLIEMEDTKIDESDSYIEDVRNHSARNIDEAELVGTSTFKNKFLDMINAHYDDSNARVICVVGMGGLGKTTVVRTIYESKEGIENKFPCRAWVTLSQSFSRIDVLKDMIRQLFGDDDKATMLRNVAQLGKYIIEKLKEKRYFVVVDDLWAIEAWNWIRDICFPSINNKESLIVITTRDVLLARACTTKLDSKPFILELKPLEEKHSIDLLLRKMRKSKQDMENDEKLKTIVTKLVKKCGGIPLAIITIGAMFATKNESDWGRLCTELPTELENNVSLEAIRRMVTQSYNHLPSHLKPCFLYLSIFPEDFEIKRRRLVDRWIAEGLVRARVGMDLEKIGIDYFVELIGRSMIQPYKVNFEGTVKSCRIHDIMRDIIVSLSREEGLVHTSSDNVPSLVEENARHVAYHVNKCSTVAMDWSRVRSLSFFGERPVEYEPSVSSPRQRMLRALDLEDAHFEATQKDINNIGPLRHLKYVNIGFSSSYALPRSIGRLKGLQVLDIGLSYISSLPTEVCKLQSLRCLRCRRMGYYTYFDPDRPAKCLMSSLRLPLIFTPLVGSKERNEMVADLHMAYSSRWFSSQGVKFPRGIGKLKELQILETVSIKRTRSKAIKELGELSKLRKLRVNTEGATETKWLTLCKAIQKLPSLGSLEIEAHRFGRIEWVDSISTPPSLRTLTLRGQIGDKVEWFGYLTQLVKLYLDSSGIEEDKCMETLGELPKLMLLSFVNDAYSGTELVFRRDKFLNLRYLSFACMNSLREIRFEQDALPQLANIQISSCMPELGINGINHLPKLKVISLSYWGYGPEEERLGMLQEHVNAHPNQPVLRLRR